MVSESGEYLSKGTEPVKIMKGSDSIERYEVGAIYSSAILLVPGLYNMS